MEEFIPPEHVLKELEGKEQWEYAYVEPIPGENDTMKDTATRDKLVAKREETVKEWEKKTVDWIARPGDETIRREREALAEKLRKGYWELDPYLRARSLYDRIGVLQKGGKVVPYPGETNGEKKEDGKEGGEVNGEKEKEAAGEVKADADDVD